MESRITEGRKKDNSWKEKRNEARIRTGTWIEVGHNS